MAKAARKVRRPRQVKYVDWRPEHREFFRILFDDWRPPAQIKVTLSTSRSTWEAGFRDAQGQLWRAKTRLHHYPSGRIAVLEWAVSTHYSFTRADLPSSGQPGPAI